MNDHRGNPLLTVGLLLAAGFCLAMIYAMWQIGSATLRTMGLIFVGGITLALVIGAAAIPIRAWRRNDSPPVIERHFTDGTRTIIKERVLDGRPPTQTDIKLLQLPAQPQAGAYPDLLRAAFAAGATQLPARRASPSAPPPDYSEDAIDELDLDEGAGWAGDIRA